MIQRLRRRTPVIVGLACAATMLSAGMADAAQLGSEPYRPAIHFSPSKNWMNDPNGLVWYKGSYHLFFQHNPSGDRWGIMSWGHATSPDLMHWTEQPLAIPQTFNELSRPFVSGGVRPRRDHHHRSGLPVSWERRDRPVRQGRHSPAR
ncbi:Levanase (fragment) [Nostocoides jenkinsii Ben 74]|uniref:Levanase n=1 Tax=Nostocoides jenkinsii Ben 74 TaxID=1193518 RepID=A0A077M4L8_9MICO